jgi:hypothetical protein
MEKILKKTRVTRDEKEKETDRRGTCGTNGREGGLMLPLIMRK